MSVYVIGYIKNYKVTLSVSHKIVFINNENLKR